MAEVERQTGGADWKRMRGRIKEAWGVLRDDDLDRYEGKIEQLEGYISQRTGEAREKVSHKLKQLSEELKH